jgi:hypothetical protein
MILLSCIGKGRFCDTGSEPMKLRVLWLQCALAAGVLEFPVPEVTSVKTATGQPTATNQNNSSRRCPNTRHSCCD